MIDKEKILTALLMVLEKNSYAIDKTRITILPTELAIEIYNMLSNKEKISL